MVREKYTTPTRMEDGKTSISDEAYAILEALEELASAIRGKK